MIKNHTYLPAKSHSYSAATCGRCKKTIAPALGHNFEGPYYDVVSRINAGHVTEAYHVWHCKRCDIWRSDKHNMVSYEVTKETELDYICTICDFYHQDYPVNAYLYE